MRTLKISSEKSNNANNVVADNPVDQRTPRRVIVSSRHTSTLPTSTDRSATSFCVHIQLAACRIAMISAMPSFRALIANRFASFSLLPVSE